jgi:NADH dehydrogenase FAD-containing subunit
MSQQVLLIGGGHAHLGVLDSFTRTPLRDAEVTLVSRFDRMIYSAMLPGWIAGHYQLDECAVHLPAVVERAGATFFRDRVVAIDLVERVAYTQSGAPLPFDLLSLDIGPEIDREAIRGLGEHAVSVRPVEKFVDAWQQIDARFTGAAKPGTITVVGGGAAGVEIALAIAHRVATSPLRLNVQLITGRPGLLPSLPAGVRKRVRRLLPQIGVRVIEDEAVAIGADRVQLSRAGELPNDVTIAAIGTTAARWPRDCGLKCDARGFISVNQSLQSVSHPLARGASAQQACTAGDRDVSAVDRREECDRHLGPI